MPETPNAQAMPHRRRRFWIMGIVVTAIVAATVLIALISFRHDVSPDQCAKLEQLKNISIAHLENGRHKEKRGAGQGSLAKADLGFAELAEKLPSDPLGARNLAITRLLELQEKSVEPSRALEAVEMALKLENDSATVHLLAGQIALAAEDQARAVSNSAAPPNWRRPTRRFGIRSVACGPIRPTRRTKNADTRRSAAPTSRRPTICSFWPRGLRPKRGPRIRKRRRPWRNCGKP